MIKLSIAFALAFSLFTSLKAEAKVFELSFMKFTLPDHWQCKTDKAETTCASTQNYETKQTAIIINAKETTPAETIESFYQQLSKPKGVGQVKDVKYVQIGDTKWVQAHHANSELANYDTFYWMTRVQNIAVLITYSFTSKYAANFAPLAQSMAPTFQLNKAEIDRLSKLVEVAETEANKQVKATEQPQAAPAESFAQKTNKVLKSNYTLPIIALCVILIVAALFLR